MFVDRIYIEVVLRQSNYSNECLLENWALDGVWCVKGRPIWWCVCVCVYNEEIMCSNDYSSSTVLQFF